MTYENDKFSHHRMLIIFSIVVCRHFELYKLSHTTPGGCRTNNSAQYISRANFYYYDRNKLWWKPDEGAEDIV